jgi:hypothetical protein
MRRSKTATARRTIATIGATLAMCGIMATASLEVAPANVAPGLDKHHIVEHDSPWSMSASAAGGKTVDLTDFVIDPGASVLTGTVSVDGDVAAEDAPLFFLDGRTLKPLQAGDNGTAVLEGTTVKLKAEAAGLLNQTVGIDDLQEGLTIGVAKITINTSA